MPRNINKIPAKISKYFDGMCFRVPPAINPKFELTNVTNAIKTDGFNI